MFLIVLVNCQALMVNFARFLMILLVDSWTHEFSVENQPIFRVWVKIGYPNSWMVTLWLFHIANLEITRFNR